jgi:tetratricopeptide repeat protein
MAGDKKPPARPNEKPSAPGDDGSIEVDTEFDELFEEAPATQPTVPALPEEGTLEVPAAGINRTAGVDVEGPVFFAPILPEMEAEIWQAGIQALVTVPERAEPPVASSDAWHAEWIEEARLFQAESVSAETPVLAAGLLMAAARAVEIAGDPAEAASGYDEALARAPTAPDVLRARARLAESVGDFDEAHALWARLAMSAGTAEERAFYGALSAEWTLARRGGLPAVALDAIPAGPARALAVVEEALRRGTPDGAATAFAAAGRALGGRFGAAFLEQAARFSVVARDAASATTHRTAARKLDPDRSAMSPHGLLGRLREAARTDRRGGTQLGRTGKIGTSGKIGDDGSADLAQILAALPAGSALAQAVGRWAAARARRRGDPAGALALLTSLGATTAAAARDRLDLEVLSGGTLDEESLARLRERSRAPAAAANLIWLEAGDLVRRGEHQAAAALLAPGIEEHADAVPLALLAEEIARATDDPALEAGTLDLWLRGDPARRADAALALAATLEANGSGLNARAALQTAMESAPESASFWIAAASDARAGRRGDAAAVLAFGAEVWESSSLVPGLLAAAAVKVAPSDPARALAALGQSPNGSLSDAALALGPSAVARLAERAGDRAAFEAALDAAEAVTRDPAQAAWLALRRASSIASGGNPADAEARLRSLERALEVVARHPLALGLYLAEPEVEAAAAAAVMARVGSASPEISAFSRTMALAAASTLALSGDREGALRCATEILAAAPADPEARAAVARTAAALGGPRGLRALADLPVAPAERDSARSLTVGEARIEVGASEAAGEALRILAGGRFGADARRAGARINLPGVVPFPPELFAARLDQLAAESRAAVAAIVDAASAGRWDDLVAALAGAPPHEATAGAGTMALAALIAEGHGDDATADRLAGAAVRADDAAAPLPALARVAGSAADTAVRSRALTALTARLGAAESDRRSAAGSLAERARLEEGAGDPAAAAESWRASLAAEPTFLPAARALRIAAARTGDSAATSEASETEAACLLVPANRVSALLLSAALALEANPPGRERALGLLRAALAIDPGHDAAFERLRAVLTELNDAPALAAALAARIEVAANPFEVTSLRLTRADLLAGTLDDWIAARQELEAVLLRQPEHARALERLSELLWTREAWAEAGEIYLRRAVVERDPATLRGIFLRLGEIYSSRVPDATRAAAAYERVLGVDPENLEALRALSDLAVAEGDIKRALPVTEKLVAQEPDLGRRHRTRIRLGELLMQTGDLRRAAGELRRVVDESPRDLGAIAALAQLLDRARDQAGRRTVLDRAVRLHRQDLGGPEGVQLATLRGLATLQTVRERHHAALAAAQLIAAVGGGTKEGVRAASRSGRSLAGLRRPELDDRLYSSEALPPGIRQLMRQLGPLLRASGPELAQRLDERGVTRADRRTRSAAPRPLFDAVADELGVADFELYVKTVSPTAGPVPLRAEPTSPPVIIIGSRIEQLGPGALRFAAARALRLVSTNLDAILAGSPEEAGALLVGIIRQFVPDYEHKGVRDSLIDFEMSRAERAIPRKLKPQVMPFAVESAGAFDLAALYEATRDAANAVGLLAAGDLPAALAVILAISGTGLAARGTATGGSGLTLEALGANPEAMALLQFAVSDEFDELARELES